MYKSIIIISLILFLSTVSVAQISKDTEPVIPRERQYDTGHCYEYQTKMLFAATDTSLTLEEQQKYLNAAKAYEQLDSIGQAC